MFCYARTTSKELPLLLYASRKIKGSGIFDVEESCVLFMSSVVDRDRRTLSALSLIVKFFLMPVAEGGRGYRQHTLGDALDVGQSEVSRIKLEQREPSPNTKDSIARLLGIDPPRFRANLELFAEGVITFDLLVPDVAKICPYEGDSATLLDGSDGDEIEKLLLGLLPRLDLSQLIEVSHRASEIASGRLSRSAMPPVAQRFCQDLGKARMREVFGLTSEQVDLILDGQIPPGLKSFQAAVLFCDRAIDPSQFLPD